MSYLLIKDMKPTIMKLKEWEQELPPASERKSIQDQSKQVRQENQLKTRTWPIKNKEPPASCTKINDSIFCKKEENRKINDSEIVLI